MIFHKIPGPWRVLLVLALLAGVGFRLYNLDKKVFWMDEAASGLLLSGYTRSEFVSELSAKPVWSAAEYLKFQKVDARRGTLSTVRALASDDPQHPPLFYVMLRVWAGIFGDSIHSLRLFSALLSLFFFPALWWFCRELFRDEAHASLISSVTLGLMAILPFNIHYAQEVRQYGFLTVLFLFSSACLLRALRIGDFRSWLLYSVSLVLGFYTHTLFALMWFAHAAIVLAFAFLLPQEQMPGSKSEPQKQPRKSLLAFAGATLVMAILFLPWALLLWNGQMGASRHTSWISNSVSIGYLVKTWIFNIGNLFFDVNHNQSGTNFWSTNPFAMQLVRIVRFCALLLPFLACYSIFKTAPRRTALVIGLLILIPFLAFAIPDIITSGRRSAIPRFMIPCYLGVQLAVTYYLAGRIYESSKRVLWECVLGILICGALISNIVSAQAQVWWTKSVSWNLPRVAEIVNEGEKPLLFGPCDGHLLAITHLLDPEVRIYPLYESSTKNSSQVLQKVRQVVRELQPDAVYFSNLSSAELAVFQKQGVILDISHSNYKLWRVQKFGEEPGRVQQPKSDLKQLR